MRVCVCFCLSVYVSGREEDFGSKKTQRAEVWCVLQACCRMLGEQGFVLSSLCVRQSLFVQSSGCLEVVADFCLPLFSTLTREDLALCRPARLPLSLFTCTDVCKQPATVFSVFSQMIHL